MRSSSCDSRRRLTRIVHELRDGSVVGGAAAWLWCDGVGGDGSVGVTLSRVHRHIRKAIKTRGHFPDEQAATKLIYLAIERAETKWRSARAWTAARRALKIHFGDRFPD